MFFIFFLQVSSRPNVIVIVADDMGRHDLTSAGSKIQTPNLDSLSEMGVKERAKFNRLKKTVTKVFSKNVIMLLGPFMLATKSYS